MQDVSAARASKSKADAIEFVDAHHHLQDLERNDYPWLAGGRSRSKLAPDIQPLRRSYLVDDLKSDMRGGIRLVKSVHVQNGWDPADPVGETRWLQGQADTTGFPNAIVAFADLKDRNVEAVLEGHASCPNSRGIRQILNWHEDAALTVACEADLMDDVAWRNGYALLRRFGFSFDLQIFPAQMDRARRLAASFPDTSIILNHFGMPIDWSRDGILSWEAAMKRLAGASNVAVKLSGFGIGRKGWTLEDVGPVLLRAVDAFGVDRCLCGTNLPFDRLYAEPAQIIAMLEWLAKKFGPEDSRKLLKSNSEKYYRI